MISWKALYFLLLNWDPERLGDSGKITQLLRERDYGCAICNTM